ncbi:sensor histidine kinase [Pedobacter duraquae]|uniref:histidine kinase n=1 Tax=Pedobacter duraquae TaxID=425511 RepID=A0A4R6IE40_9SPHI|nr:histidine kinase [Pedobacter duraquae]TDO20234.1 histidine kinase [Pedobacter duraquae]
MFGYIYYQTLHAGLPDIVDMTLGGPLYALGMNCLITVFLGGFMAYQQHDQECDRANIRALQDQKINILDEAVKQRTEQLNSMRESIATDFHDETGNMLSTITRQAALLKMKLSQDHQVQPIVDQIIINSNALYASSKDFLWHLNHDSDNPEEVFDYLTAYGQLYYNQFDIAFSSNTLSNILTNADLDAQQCRLLQLDPRAALHIIYIFKEAMTNVVNHAGATEVQLSMSCTAEAITYILTDNGSWKNADAGTEHYGLGNMQRRCLNNQFEFDLVNASHGTQIMITVPVSTPENLVHG